MTFNGYFQFVPDSGTSWNELEMAKLKEQTELFLTNAGYPILWDKRKTFSELGLHGWSGTSDRGPQPGPQNKNWEIFLKERKTVVIQFIIIA